MKKYVSAAREFEHPFEYEIYNALHDLGYEISSDGFDITIENTDRYMPQITVYYQNDVVNSDDPMRLMYDYSVEFPSLNSEDFLSSNLSISRLLDKWQNIGKLDKIFDTILTEESFRNIEEEE